MRAVHAAFLASLVASVAADAQCWPAWSSAAAGGTNQSGGALCFTRWQDGSKLIVAGGFESLGGSEFANIAAWTGQGWDQLGGGFGPAPLTLGSGVWSLCVLNEPNGPSLFAAGLFGFAGGKPAMGIARWDGSEWHDVGGGISGPTLYGTPFGRDLEAFDDGSGPAIYLTGWFGHAGGIYTGGGPAKWNGAEWSAVGGLVETSNNGGPMTVWDDGTGPALYYVTYGSTWSGGSFPPGIIRWDGTAWVLVGSDFKYNSGIPAGIYTLGSYRDQHGSFLVAGGPFEQIGLLPALRVARWDGANWSQMGLGFNLPAQCFITHDDGAHGPCLYAGGDMTASGQTTLNRLARWDGFLWQPLAPGLKTGTIYGLGTFDDGSGPTLWVGGSVKEINGKTSWGIAKYTCTPCDADCDADHDLDIFDYLCFLDRFAQGSPYCDFEHDGDLDLFDFLAFQNEFVNGCP